MRAAPCGEAPSTGGARASPRGLHRAAGAVPETLSLAVRGCGGVWGRHWAVWGVCRVFMGFMGCLWGVFWVLLCWGCSVWGWQHRGSFLWAALVCIPRAGLKKQTGLFL